MDLMLSVNADVFIYAVKLLRHDRMLRKFAVENYRNFIDRTELDMTAVRNYSFNPQCEMTAA